LRVIPVRHVFRIIQPYRIWNMRGERVRTLDGFDASAGMPMRTPLAAARRTEGRMPARNPSLSAILTWSGLIVAALLLSSCNQQKTEQIQWQLPLATPQDPHGANVTQTLPDWAAAEHGSADIALLHTNTAEVFDVSVSEGPPVISNGFSIQLLGLAQGLRIKSGAFIDDKNVHNPAAFVEISKDGKVIYHGWLYQDFPELFGPDIVEWKIWAKDISIQSSSAQPSSGATPKT
jgi:hypothetical protein